VRFGRSEHLIRVVVVAAALGCGSTTRTANAPESPERIAIIAAERGPLGARLVAIDEGGDRRFDLLEMPAALARDSHPAVSPDGRWLVFASSRERRLDETSLWIAPLAAEAVPVRLTSGTSIESHPVWTRDGAAIVFASTRDGGDFDLYRLAMRDGRGSGAPVRLTDAPGHEVTPTVASDGTVFYTAVTPREEGGADSHIEARDPNGAIRRVTEGPADTSPSLSPDERTLAFARPKQHRTGLDSELWTMPRDGVAAVQLIDLPLTDESGPVWSPDGRYVFATSVLRGATGNAVFSSVIVIDTREQPIKARLLEDRAGAVARLTPAVTRVPLDARALAADPEYLPELARIMASAIAKQKQEQEQEAP
jgi:Tol biopolymer transport system component